MKGAGGLKKSPYEAVRLYKLAAAQGHRSAQYLLATLYSGGQAGLRQDDREAVRLYKRFADEGDAWAQTQLGFFYVQGRGGLPKDEREAARLFKLAAERGYADAQAKLGVFYSQGLGGLPQDDREAARLYKLSADQANASAQTMLGTFRERGRGGLPKDEIEAARLFKLAADQGYAFAQGKLALFNERGRGGLPKDDREAARLFKLAADQGDALAQGNLGLFYLLGRGGLPQDDREAARLFRLSANQGHAWAQGNLGVLYEQGVGGLPQDDLEAARLYKLAADQAMREAQDALARLGHNHQQEERERQREAAEKTTSVAWRRKLQRRARQGWRESEERQLGGDPNIAGKDDPFEQQPRGSPKSEPQHAIRVETPESLATAERRDEPVMPKLPEFGFINEDDLPAEPTLPSPKLILFVISGMMLISYFGNNISLGAAASGTALVVLAVSYIGMAIRNKVNATFRNAVRYRSALRKYECNLSEYKRRKDLEQEQRWRGLSGIQFEIELGRLFEALGYKVSQTPSTGDGGVDLVLTKEDQKTVVQCKAHNRKITIDVARQLVASMQDFGAKSGIIACLEGATTPTMEYIQLKRIRVIDLGEIISLQRSVNSGSISSI